MKKAFAIILSFYIITLLVVPCADVHEDICRHTTEHATDNQPVSHQSGCDCCSPFCTCNCCTSPVPVQFDAILFNDFSFITQKYLFGNTLSVPSAVCVSIWQPPKSC